MTSFVAYNEREVLLCAFRVFNVCMARRYREFCLKSFIEVLLREGFLEYIC